MALMKMNLILSYSINYNLTFKGQMEQIILFSKKKRKKSQGIFVWRIID